MEAIGAWHENDVISNGMKISLPVVDSLEGDIQVVQLDPADNIVVEGISEEYNIVQLDSNDTQLNLTELKSYDDNMVTLWHVNTDFEIEVRNYKIVSFRNSWKLVSMKLVRAFSRSRLCPILAWLTYPNQCVKDPLFSTPVSFLLLQPLENVLNIILS